MIKLTGLSVKFAALLCLAGMATAHNPVVISPRNMTYGAGDTIEIKWANATTGYVNIDLVCTNSHVLQFPLAIASGVNGEEGKYSWKVPAELKTAAGYCIRVWGTQQPRAGDSGMSQQFTVFNAIPEAVNTFVVLTPNKDKPCALGSVCKITWDFPTTDNYPAMVDINLYRVGNPMPILQIATVSSTLKGYSWQVPQDPSLMSGDVYISVSGQGIPPVGPKMGNSMGANSGAFIIAKEEIVELTVSSCSTSTTSTSSTSTSTTSTTSRISAASKNNKNAAAASFSSSELVRLLAIMATALAMVPLVLIL